MAKQRPSVLKIQREQQKRHRDQKKAEKAARKRERRQNRVPGESKPPVEEGQVGRTEEADGPAARSGPN